MSVAELLARDRFAAALGVRLVQEGSSGVVVECDVAEHHLDRRGRVAVGALFALADCAMSLASNVSRTAVAVSADLVRPVDAPGGGVMRAAVEAASSPAEPAVTWHGRLTVDGVAVAAFTGTTLAVDR